MAYLKKTNEHWLYYGAFPDTFRLSRHLRKIMTPAEKELWKLLRNRSLGGFKFRRQHPVREFVVDFFCFEKELVIELDGGIHREKEVTGRDQNRTAEMERMGLKVLRFTNKEVMNDPEKVLKKIEAVLLSPSPPGEGAGG
jgi:very-short-patch-repair endonuclease